MKFS
jgi:hypothetical protein